MFKTSTPTALVPCYNEKDRIGDVLKVLVESQYINKVLVVDDGSTDGTQDIVKEFKNVELLRLDKNIGKGGAVREGLKRVGDEYTFLLDADLKGLTNEKIGLMIKPVFVEGYDACFGVLKRGPAWFQFFRKNIFPVMTGERVLRTDVLKNILDSPNAQEWGIEFYMNLYLKKKGLRVKKIDLVAVTDVMNFKKRGFRKYFIRLIKFWIINLKLFWLNLFWKE